MILGKIKYKNQLTIPSVVANLLKLKQNDTVCFEVKNGKIVIIPVSIEPRYTPDELKAIDDLVAREKKKAKIYSAGKEFVRAIEKL